MPQRSVQRQQRVGSQILIRRKLLVIAVFADGSPPRKQRPHRSVVVSAAAENRGTVRNDSHPPIRLVLGGRQLLNRRNSGGVVRQTKPHRYRRFHRQLVHLLVVLVQSKCKPLLIGYPETIVHQRPLLRKFTVQRRGRIFVPRKPRQISECSQRLRPQPALVELALHREQRATFHPAMPESLILRQPLRVVRRLQELIRLPKARPFRLCKLSIAAVHHIIVR